MYGVDIVNLAKMLKSESRPLLMEARCVYAEMLMEKVAELVNLNDPLQEQILIDDLTLMYNAIFDPNEVLIIPILIDYVNDVRQAMKDNFWDPRCKIKIKKQRLDKRFHRVYFIMDLDATAHYIYAEAVPTTNIEYIEDVVDDNPSQELLEQYEMRRDFVPTQPKPRT